MEPSGTEASVATRQPPEPWRGGHESRHPQLYSHPRLLWIGLPLILYRQMCFLVFAHSGDLDVDPVTFALRERVGCLALAVFLIAAAGGMRRDAA